MSSPLNKSVLLASLFLTPTLALAEMTNGDFEQWSSSSPTGWNTIDSGISVSQETSIVKSGSNAAKVTVNTGTQSNTDFQQSVSVVSGQTYNFSVSVYHTEGNVKARLYVDGYQNYSVPSQTGQWQDIAYSYTASSTKSINVGLRFYDESGFDGSEVVYIDNFQPSDGAVTPPPTTCSNHEVTLNLTTDSYGSETSWTLKNSSNQTLFSGSDYGNNTSYEKAMCVESGPYVFEIVDSYGDGICCSSGNGSYTLTSNGQTLASGGDFTNSSQHSFTLGGSDPDPEPPVLGDYYKSAEGKTGYTLKTALYNIINNHNSQGYSAVWDLVKTADIDNYYEKDGTILDIYSEKVSGSDSINFTKVTDQCGQYSKEGDCYNREHSFPKSWFGGKVEPMNSDGHHLYATDGYVNAKRSNWPFGEVGSATYTSSNGSKVGSAASSLGYSGTVFEPIDEFKGDLARAYFYMATRYENEIANWEGNSDNSNAVLNGTNTTVFEPWVLAMLKRWHANDPVDQKEIDRNNAVYNFQGNRNPYVDHPEFVNMVWGD
ncbi:MULTISPECIES: endonuclease [Vibrio]|uniref:endonuclease n=1 Tax=Vibrio TaxID=662 RepID=UPI0001B95060|nr:MULTISPECIES: endonuclease [Vibrio]EEX32194.1 endonuclease I [Vibrio coralliilyticus ATCC BAA-450]MCM5510516.1 endonuclease [Vibrio sp. SCSIO 43169]MDE3897848.1 endonuclease [Vibrio sp. CC007]QFT39506.1 Extracellular ribonuclease precursor [Vibrio sp. THAF64]QGM35956.1 Extracellular ribonuclease precursor [Vibrio sp. THAF191d]